MTPRSFACFPGTLMRWNWIQKIRTWRKWKLQVREKQGKCCWRHALDAIWLGTGHYHPQSSSKCYWGTQSVLFARFAISLRKLSTGLAHSLLKDEPNYILSVCLLASNWPGLREEVNDKPKEQREAKPTAKIPTGAGLIAVETRTRRQKKYGRRDSGLLFASKL